MKKVTKKPTEQDGKTSTKPATARKGKGSVKATTASKETGKDTTDDATPTPEFPSYDEVAWKWMANQSIPGAFSPIMYIGQEVSRSIADILGRSMTLEEAQYLVRPDGPFVMCASEDVEFQPVEYVFRVPPGLKEKIAAGQKLTEVGLITGGAFYIDHKKGVAVALSGSVFQYNNRATPARYEWCKSSPLVIAAEESRKMAGYMKWGAPTHQVQKILDAKNQAKTRRNKIAGIMTNLVPQHRFGNNVGQDVDEALRRRGGKNNKRNGHHRHERELQEN